jgi:large subunit ribosomal protein L19
MKNRLIALVEDAALKKEVPAFEVGDTIDVHVRILEGQKERVQIFNGTVIARRGGGMRAMFTVRRIVQGEGVERQFPLHSPKIAKIEVKRTGRVRRAKLYYLRDRVGKATRLREREDKATKADIAAKKAEKAAKRAEKQAQAGS